MNTYRCTLAFLFGLPLALLGQVGQALNQQAQTQANIFWNQKLTRCGDTVYIAYKSGEVDAFKNGKVVIQARQLREADRLNGLEWAGVSGFTATSTRIWVVRETAGVYGPRGWQPWASGSGAAGVMGLFSASLEKRRGVWSVVPNPNGPFNQFKPFNCSQVPPEQFDPNSAVVQQEVKGEACRKLTYAATQGSPGSLQTWLNMGVDAKTCRDEAGTTVLMAFANQLYPSEDDIRRLLSLGVDVNARNNAGLTAKDLAQQNYNEQLPGGRRAGYDDASRASIGRVISLLQNSASPAPDQAKRAKKKSAPEGAIQASGPEVTLWNQLKNQLTAQDGDNYFVSQLRYAAIPKLKGTVVAGRPICHSRELLVAILDSVNAEVTLRLETPLSGLPQLGTQIEWQGVPSAFVKAPFMVTMDTANSKVTGLQILPCGQ